MSLEVGTAFARLGAHLDDDGFDRFDRRLRDAREHGRRGAEAELKADVDTRGFERYERKIADVDRGHANLVRGSGRLKGAMGSLFIGGAGVAAAGVGFGLLAKGAMSAVGAFEESEVAARRQALVIKSMGQDAGATAEHVDKLSAAIMRKTGIDDDQIKSATNVLRTFKGVTNEAGAGNAMFDRVTKAAVDLSSALGTDLQGTMIQLGKAFNEPAKGAAALGRSGTVTKADVQTLKDMAEAGAPVLEQQRFLAEAVEKQVKGTAESNATATMKIKASFGELMEFIGEKIAPTFNSALDSIRGFVDGIVSGQGGLGNIGTTIKTAFGDVVGVVTDVVRWVTGAITTLANDKGIQAFVDNVRRFAGDLAGYVSDVVGKIIDTVKSIQPELETIGRAILSVANFLIDGFRKILPALEQIWDGILGVIKGFVKVIAGILSLDFAKVWEGLKDIVGGALNAVAGVIRVIGNQIKTAFGAVFRGFAAVAGAAWDAVTGVVKAGLDFILGGVTTMLGIMADIANAGSHLPFVGGKFKDLANEIDGAKDSIDKFREGLRDADPPVERMGKSVGEAAGRVTELRNRLKHLKAGTDDYRATARELRRAQRDLNKELRAADAAGRKGAKGVSSIAGGAFSASSAVGSAAGAIRDNVNALARSLGAQGINFTVAKTAPGRQNQAAAFGGDLGDVYSDLTAPELAGGGHIVGGVKGARGRDDRILLDGEGRPEAVVGAGELLVFNADQQKALDAMARGVGIRGGLDEFFAASWRPHHYAGGGRVTDYRLAGPRGGYQREGDGALRYLDLAAEAKVRKMENEPIHKMTRFARAEAAKGYSYVYGGGHGGFHGPYDCSGYVSAILNAGGILDSGAPMTTDGLKTWGQAGDGKVTVGVRGSTGRSAHTMIRLGNAYFESGSGHGAAETGGWSGGFPIHRTHGLAHLAAGGRLGGRRVVAWDELPDRVKRKLAERPEALEPGNADFVGFGLDGGGKLPRHKINAGMAGKSAKAGARGLAGWERKISNLERRYGQQDRAYGMSEEELIRETDDGAELNQPGIQKRWEELGELYDTRWSIRDNIAKYQAAVARSIKRYQEAIRRITAALKAVPAGMKGNTAKAKRSRADAAKTREGYRDRLASYRERLGGLRETGNELEGDLVDTNLDLRELNQERRALWPDRMAKSLAEAQPEPKDPDPITLDSSMSDDEKASAANLGKDASLAALTETTDDDELARAGQEGLWRGILDRLIGAGAPPDVIAQAADTLAGFLKPGDTTGVSTGGAGGGSSTDTPAAPTVEDIADGVAKALSTFNASRADLFGQFGANFMLAGQGFGPGGAAAGTRYFGGGSSGGRGGAIAAAGGVVQHITFEGPQPANPHVFAQTTLHELEAAL